jgi:hypothetical protein
MLQEEYERAEQERKRRKELEEETRKQREMLQRAIEKARQEEVKRREAEEEVERQERLVQPKQNRVMQFEEDFDRCLRDAVNQVHPTVKDQVAGLRLDAQLISGQPSNTKIRECGRDQEESKGGDDKGSTGRGKKFTKKDS